MEWRLYDDRQVKKQTSFKYSREQIQRDGKKKETEAEKKKRFNEDNIFQVGSQVTDITDWFMNWKETNIIRDRRTEGAG